MKISIEQFEDEFVIYTFEHDVRKEFTRVSIDELVTTYLNLYYPICANSANKS